MSEGSWWRRIVRAVWNGPFFVGKLTQPISTGDAIMKLLETLWRVIVVVILVPAIGVVLIAAWVGWLQPIVDPPLSKQVDVYVRYDDGTVPIVTTTTGAKTEPFRCTKDYPLLVQFINRSSKTIRKVSFSVEVTEPSHSNNLWTGSIFIDSDGVIPPGMGWNACYTAMVQEGHDPAGLEYKGSVNYVEN